MSPGWLQSTIGRDAAEGTSRHCHTPHSSCNYTCPFLSLTRGIIGGGGPPLSPFLLYSTSTVLELARPTCFPAPPVTWESHNCAAFASTT